MYALSGMSWEFTFLLWEESRVYAPPLALSTHSGQLGTQRVESYHLEALNCANALEFR